MTPIPLGVEVAEKQPILQPALDCGDCRRDFARHN
jgi:hypothetical protein